ncbi:MAG: aldehyde dehydrogenase family protein, partial [Gammaproteobacteria bacterium]|nr:aldehyde dehydrogenase family protein [Gammaproteobacteria bacterium]
YRENQLDEMVDKINASGYGLTLGMQSRIDDRIQRVCERAHVGNIYVNRNQIGAVVGVQPFGGEGKSGTGPKAGGPFYLYRFCRAGDTIQRLPADRRQVFDDQRQSWENSAFRFDALMKFAHELGEPLADVAKQCLLNFREFSSSPVILDGPTGEMNTIALHPRGKLFCLGDAQGDQASLSRQMIVSLLAGNSVVLQAGDFATRAATAIKAAGLSASLLEIAEGDSEVLLDEHRLHGVVCDADAETLKRIRKQLAARDGARVALLSQQDDIYRFTNERVISIDTTAAGGNASLLTI